jgi:hypothetical protein
MPEIQSLVEQSVDKRITVVGLNIDADPGKAKSVVAKHKWNWSQNYLGDHSEMSKQLGIGSVPTYFLIGTDGLLVASSSDWSVIKSKIEEIEESTASP